MELYDFIGLGYDKTRCADPYITSRLIHHLDPNNQGRYLDVGCGTGNYTIALKKEGIQMVGIDPSSVMLKNASQKDDSIEWCLSHAEKMPFMNSTFNGCICVSAIHHFTNILESLYEIFRVIEYGRAVFFTCSHEQIKGYWLNHYFPKTLNRLCEYMPNIDVLKSCLLNSGFKFLYTEKYDVHDELKDNFIYSKKRMPHIYLDDDFRKGLSVFVANVEFDEVYKGCEQLKEDIHTGIINDVLLSYDNDFGDYMFIVAEKE